MKPIDVLTSPWAIIPEKLNEIIQIYSTHLRGEKIDLGAIEAAAGQPLQRAEQGYQVRDGVALIPVDGVIAKRMNLFTRISGGVSTELVARDLRAAAADRAVASIVLVIDSPGGAVDGTQGLANVVAQVNAEKPVVAFADGLMASAAYWIGSAADSIWMSGDTAHIGSIGVVTSHVDMSAYEQKLGIKTTEIFAGRYKRIASEHAPLSTEGRDYIQAMVDQLYTTFVGEVARFRGVTPEQVLADMADGRIFIGQRAIEAGLVDGASTLDDLVAQLAAGEYSRRRSIARTAIVDAAVTSAGAALPTETTEQEKTMDKDQIAKEYPAIAEAFRSDGAEAERNRIKDVESQALAGHEALVASLKFDGKTTGPEAAAQILAAERTKRQGMGQALADDAPTPIPGAPTPTADPAAGPDLSGLSVEERSKREWEASATVREQYGSLAGYTAFQRAQADGRVRMKAA